MGKAVSMPVEPHPILLYDGVCGLCNRAVRFVLRHDRDARFRFAALQSRFAAEILSRHHLGSQSMETMVVVLHPAMPNEQLLVRSDGALYLLRNLAQPWPALARLAALLPHAVRDAIYRFVATWRYSIFGKYDSCPLPAPEVKRRFLDHDIPSNSSSAGASYQE